MSIAAGTPGRAQPTKGRGRGSFEGWSYYEYYQIVENEALEVWNDKIEAVYINLKYIRKAWPELIPNETIRKKGK